MTRPKVPDDRRQRTAQACDLCKRRKQKCDGLKPCNTCQKRKLICEYNTPNAHVPDDDAATTSMVPPAKRRQIEKYMHGNVPGWEESGGTSAASEKGFTSTTRHPFSYPFDWERFHADFECYSIYNQDVGQDEEVPLIPLSIFLEGSDKGSRPPRLWFLGTASNSAFLATMRIVVEEIAGAEPTHDLSKEPNRFRINEDSPLPISFPEIWSDGQKINAQAMPYFPQDRELIDILVESYFVNTFGLVEIFDRSQFLHSIDECYGNPQLVDRSFLCHFYLVLALGLVLAAPVPGSREEQVIRGQLSESPDRAEHFFQSAKASRDPAATVLEGADIWSIQGLCLMSTYMLARWRRNAAYLHLGIAVRSAYSLGLHSDPKNHGGVLFEEDDIKVRQNVWKSLFILECFCSTALGRPMAISDDDSWVDLKMPDVGLNFPGSPRIFESEEVHTHAVDGAVRCCHIIDVVTKKLYKCRGEKISTATARKVADKYMSTANWKEKLRHSYELWRQASRDGRLNATRCGNAVLHVHLFHLHATILFTRPFFLLRVSAVRNNQSVGGSGGSGGLEGLASHRGSRLDGFAEDCVRASFHTIHLVQTVREAQGLPRKNPFVLYFLHAACLVVLSNEFASLYGLDDFPSAMATAKAYVNECCELNPQAQRILSVLESFHKVVEIWKAHPNNKGKGVVRPEADATMASTTPGPRSDLLGAAARQNYTSFQDHFVEREPSLTEQQSTAWSGTDSGQSSSRRPAALSISQNHQKYAFSPSRTPSISSRMVWTPRNDGFSPLNHSPTKMSRSRSTDVISFGGAPGRHDSGDFGSSPDVLDELSIDEDRSGTWSYHDRGGGGGGGLEIAARLASLTTQGQQQLPASTFQPPPPPHPPVYGPPGPRIGSFGSPSPTTTTATSAAGPGLSPSTMNRMRQGSASSRPGMSRSESRRGRPPSFAKPQ